MSKENNSKSENLVVERIITVDNGKYTELGNAKLPNPPTPPPPPAVKKE